MGSDLTKPPDSPEALAKLIGGEKPSAAGKPDKKPAAKPDKIAPKDIAAKDDTPKRLPIGKMGQPCAIPRADGSKCPGKLTDLGGHFHDRKAKVTRTTLVCTKCSQVQAQSEVRDLE